eukprot:3900479-Prymnesium_polylepis.2
MSGLRDALLHAGGHAAVQRLGLQVAAAPHALRVIATALANRTVYGACRLLEDRPHLGVANVWLDAHDGSHIRMAANLAEDSLVASKCIAVIVIACHYESLH